jgi:hypothetical protein
VKLASRMPPAIWSVELSKILVSPSTRNIRSYAPLPLKPALFTPALYALPSAPAAERRAMA